MAREDEQILIQTRVPRWLGAKVKRAAKRTTMSEAAYIRQILFRMQDRIDADARGDGTVRAGKEEGK